jgi:penicillin amidase
VGNIGEHSTGLAPLRKNWTGVLPIPARAGYEWAGYVPTSELPHSLNPAAGFIATANHKTIPEKYPYNVGFEWAAPYRFHRIQEVLSHARDSGRKITLQDMAELQTDVMSLPARHLLELLRKVPLKQPDSAAQLLLQWDATLSRDSAAAALYEMWLRRLQKAMTEKAKLEKGLGDLSVGKVLQQLSAAPADVFGANPGTARNQLLLQTLEDGWHEIQQLEGPNSQNWSWGKMHTVRFRHSLDQGSGNTQLLDLGPLARPSLEMWRVTGRLHPARKRMRGVTISRAAVCRR